MLLGYFISLIQDTTVPKCNILSISIPRLFSVRPMKVPVARIITTTLDHAYVRIVGPLIMYLKKLNYSIFCFDFFISHKSWHACVIYFTQIQIIPYKMIQDKTKVFNLYLTDIVFLFFYCQRHLTLTVFQLLPINDYFDHRLSTHQIINVLSQKN